jgi:hypothetical protein
MIRRGLALGGGLLILILLVLGVKGCLNARKERALKDYARDVSQIVDETAQTSKAFFGRLEDPGDLSVSEFQNEINADRSAMDGYLSRIESLDTPGDMSRAQNGLELVYQLRANAMGTIAVKIPTALGDAGREAAISDITHQMRSLLASDVLYEDVVRPEINGVLHDNGIDDRDVPESQFLPDGIEWLDESKIDSALSGVSGGSTTSTGACPCGTGLIGVTVSGTTLAEGVPVTVSGDGPPEVDVQVQNQGVSELSGVTVSVTVNGGSPITQDISSIAAGETQTATISLTPAPTGEATLDVQVEAVDGEEVTDNNEASYTVTFQ